jgi:MarR-like DNA-binding transcriptional regulator SgrR of sgrS sRNA
MENILFKKKGSINSNENLKETEINPVGWYDFNQCISTIYG